MYRHVLVSHRLHSWRWCPPCLLEHRGSYTSARAASSWSPWTCTSLHCIDKHAHCKTHGRYNCVWLIHWGRAPLESRENACFYKILLHFCFLILVTFHKYSFLKCVCINDFCLMWATVGKQNILSSTNKTTLLMKTLPKGIKMNRLETNSTNFICKGWSCEKYCRCKTSVGGWWVMFM